MSSSILNEINSKSSILNINNIENQNVIIASAGGNVGIGGTPGSFKLKVSGTVDVTGDLSLNGSKITGLGTPTSNTDAATKSYTDTIITNLGAKSPVRVATSVAGTLASSFTNGSTVDGITLVTGNRILIKNQATATENGIYIVNASGAPTRSSDFANGSTQSSSYTVVNSGTTGADTFQTCTNDPGNDIVGTDNLVFAQISGGGGGGGGSVDLTAVSTHIIPDTNGVYDIGSTTKRFRNMFLNGNLISFGNGLQIDTFNWSYLANYIIPPRVAASTDSVYLFDGPALGHSAFIKNGLVYTFGNNTSGQLGLGDTTNRLIPTLVPGISGAAQVACGDSFTIILMGDGTLRSCGINSNGQLGDGTVTQQSYFVSVLNITTGISVSCGFNFALVLLANGTVFGFGSDSNGQLGNGSGNLTINSTPIAMTMPTVVTNDDLARFIDCGAYHSVVLLANGSTYVCGDNTYGQLAVDPTLLTNANTLGVVPAISNVVSAAAGHYHTILITYSGSVITFGRNQGGQLGIGTTSAYNFTPSTIITQSGSLGLSTLAAAGFQHSGVIKGDNTIVMFGNNALGQLGLGSAVVQALTPTLLPGYAGYAISAGQNHTLIRTIPQNLTYTALTGTTIIGFGDNTFGQMGDNNLNVAIRYFPNNIFTSTVLKKLGGSSGTTSSIDIDGTLYNCGNNTYGQCGYPIAGVSKRLKPVSRFKQRIAQTGKSFGNSNVILENTGKVYCYGQNTNGQLGNGTVINNDIPQLSSGTLIDKTITAIAGGGYHTIALSSIGQVYTWGYNLYGQLGNNTTTQSNIPINVSSFGSLSGQTIVAIAGGEIHAITLSSTGQVHAWGYNGSGQLGNNTTTQSNIPINVSSFGSLSGQTIVAIAGGSSHTIAISSTGQVHTWGKNDYGALGNNTTTNSSIPINVSSFGSLSGQTIVAIAGGGYHTVALSSTGQVHTWGFNGNGALGNNTTTSSNIPINVSSFGSLSGQTIVTIVSGQHHTVALSSTGQVHTWGYNVYGQLGNNTTTNSSIPINVSSFGSLSGQTIVAIAGLGNHNIALSSTGQVHAWGYNGNGTLGNNTTTNSSIPINVSSFGSLTGQTITAIASGNYHTFAISSTSQVHTWGSNLYGQLGNNTTTQSNIPINTVNSYLALSGRTVVAVAGGNTHNTALDTTGKVHSWGLNTSGQLGNNTVTQSNFPIDISSFGSLAGVGYRAITTGSINSALLSNSGQVYTWGYNSEGELGNNTTTQSNIPINISSFGSLSGQTIVAIAGGSSHTIALSSTGQVHTWGYNGYGQLGNNTTAQSNIPINVSSFGSLSGQTIVAIDAGDYHTIALSSTGQVHTWGYNISGQLGNNTTTQSNIPINVSSFGSLSGQTIIAIAGGGGHTIAISSTGQVHTWGKNDYGQLGNNTLTQSNIPTNVSSFGSLSGQTIVAIAGGGYHTIALSSTGQVHTWGLNSNGALGNNTITSSSIPINTSSFGSLSGQTIVTIASGQHHNIALSSSGQVHIWGYNVYGQLGNNTTTQSNIPINVSSFGSLSVQTIVAIAGGGEHTVALSNTGTLHAWGTNTYGQLGNGTTTQSLVPINNISFSGITNNSVVITAISNGIDFSSALDNTGKLLVWGNNGSGQLGLGYTFNLLYPMYCVMGSITLKTIIAINSMGNVMIALDSLGQVHTWGQNSVGQLGNNTTTQSNFPINISSFGTLSGKTIVAIAAGNNHGMALDSTGQVHTWGFNSSGQLGNNTITNSLIPINISTFGSLSGKTISVVAAINNNSLALDSTGQIHIWGANTSGQLGDGTTTQSNIPIVISLTTRDLHTQVLSKGIGYHKLFTNSMNNGNLTTLHAAGLNDNRQIGDNTVITRSNIVPVTTFGSNIVSSANSEFHSATVLANGTVYMWGKNNLGQCGSNTSGADIATPTLLSGISTAVQVACGVDFTIIRLVDYTLLSFGNNSVGQLGVDPIGIASRFTPTLMTSPTSITSIACGGQSNLAIDNIGNCYSWGDNTYGKLGIASGSSFVFTPTQIPLVNLDNSKTTVIDVGLNHSVLICENFNVYTAGLNLNGQLGHSTNFGTSNANNTMGNASLAPITTKPVNVACGDSHTIVHLANNTVLFFGDNNNFQCPSGGTVRWTPSLLENQYDIVSIKAGKKVSYLETDGTSQGITGPQVITYGNNRVFGRPSQISAGGLHSIALDSNLNVWTWGGSSVGQLGNNTTIQSNIPINVSSFGTLSGQTITAISNGYAHNVVISNTGQVHTWGFNNNGQLGNNTITSSLIPINISSFGSLSGVVIVSVSCGNTHSVALDSTGQVHSWGYNTYGQLGNNTTSNSNIPINVSSFGSLSGKKIVSINCGNYHSFAVDSVGQVHSWGNNGTGQLGNNTVTQSNIPVAISSFGSLSGKVIISVSPGGNSTYALSNDGLIHSWGFNNNGQLGNNTTTNSSIPINISSFGSLPGQKITAISAGFSHCIAIGSTGTVYSWGNNASGQLGNNSTTNSFVPINVSSFGTLSSKLIVATSSNASGGGASDFSMALDSTGTVHSWGGNANGTLGNNTTTQSNIPIQVSTSYIAANPLPVFQNFTGQHRCFLDGINPLQLSNYEGLIVSSNLSKYKTLTGNNKISINESLPIVSLSNKQADKSVFGIISLSSDKSDITQDIIQKYRENGDTRVEINSIGEGSLWVIETGGNLESGDYICSSDIPGYGMKQTDDIQRNYTVAKATMDCDFQGLLIQDTKIKVDSYGNNILDEFGSLIYEPIINTSVNELGETVETIQMRNFYEIRYLNESGEIITETEYDESTVPVFKAAFIGCTYHCG
jgi:alpha-tubulin suppressor-like RCC1 family protein